MNMASIESRSLSVAELKVQIVS